MFFKFLASAVARSSYVPIRRALAVVACVALQAPAVAAAPITAAGYALDATGNTSFALEGDGIINRVQSRFAGLLDSYTIWLGSVGLTGGGLRLAVFETSGQNLVNLIDSIVLSGPALTDGPTVLGGNGRSFTAVTWDLSGLNRFVDRGGELGFRIEQIFGTSVMAIAGNDAALPGALPAETRTSTFFHDGSTSGVFFARDGQSISYQLTIDPDSPPPADVPLPAGLPLLLTGMGALAWVRKRI